MAGIENPAQSFLAILPRELRAEIYKHIFESPSGRISLSRTTSSLLTHDTPRYKVYMLNKNDFFNAYSLHSCETINLGILRTCKRLCDECKGLIWKYNIVDFAFMYCEAEEYVPSMIQLSEIGSLHDIIKSSMRSMQIDLPLRCRVFDHGEFLDGDSVSTFIEFFKTCASFTNLASLTLVIRDQDQHLRERPREWARLLRSMVLDQAGFYQDFLLILEAYGTTNCIGNFLNCEKKIIVDTGEPQCTPGEFPFSCRVSGSINRLLGEISAKFGGTFWIEGVLAFRDGLLVTNVFEEMENDPTMGVLTTYKWDVQQTKAAATITKHLGGEIMMCDTFRAMIAEGQDHRSQPPFDVSCFKQSPLDLTSLAYQKLPGRFRAWFEVRYATSDCKETLRELNYEKYFLEHPSDNYPVGSAGASWLSWEMEEVSEWKSIEGSALWEAAQHD